MRDYLDRIDKRVVLMILVLAIVAVILRDFWDIYQCTHSGSNAVWNPSKKICETIIQPIKKNDEATPKSVTSP